MGFVDNNKNIEYHQPYSFNRNVANCRLFFLDKILVQLLVFRLQIETDSGFLRPILISIFKFPISQ